MSQENCVKFRAGLIKFLNFFGDFVLPCSGYNDLKPACTPRSDDEAFLSFFLLFGETLGCHVGPSSHFWHMYEFGVLFR
jgi:hypothetical protein